MKEKELFQQSFYKKVITELKAAKMEIERMVAANYYKKTAILEKANELSVPIQEQLKKGYADLKEKLEAENQKIITKYKEKPQYNNAAEELLHRQDFDMWLNLADDYELNEYISNGLKNDLNSYKLAAIKIAINSGKVKETGILEKIRSNISKLEVENHIGREWESDIEFQRNEKLLMEMLQIRPNMLWIPDEVNDYMPIEIYDAITEPMKGYK